MKKFSILKNLLRFFKKSFKFDELVKIAVLARCKDEFFVEEFVKYYLSQGIDKVYIIDDDSNDKSIYDNLLNNPRVKIFFSKNITKGDDIVNEIYNKIKDKFTWLIYVDVDEFITTKRKINNTIRDELETTFRNVHCVKVPWVMMSCNSLEKNPKSILQTNIYRWNHDLKHENNDKRKFKCRYDQIEVKSIFKPKFFKKLTDHHPNKDKRYLNSIVVDSIKLGNLRGSFYNNLREKDIREGHLLCYHYRLISIENCKNKLKTNRWYIDDGYTLQDLLSSDCPEIKDETLKKKSLKIR